MQLAADTDREPERARKAMATDFIHFLLRPKGRRPIQGLAAWHNVWESIVHRRSIKASV